MTLKVICIILAIVCGVLALSAKQLLPRLLKREVNEMELVLFKAILLLACIAIAMTMILPDYL